MHYQRPGTGFVNDIIGMCSSFQIHRTSNAVHVLILLISIFCADCVGDPFRNIEVSSYSAIHIQESSGSWDFCIPTIRKRFLLTTAHCISAADEAISINNKFKCCGMIIGIIQC